ncbi:CD99 antigen [Amblyraja radiata]|uniref:CD99 antigen n=1 Tax=Amblyraja radiata TaxID=386614 RepID=UPI0014035A09|nr:CD99 antigen [Amblyraja radiata]
MSRVRCILFLGLAIVFVRTKGEDGGFNLEDATRDDLPTLKPPAKPPAIPETSLDFNDADMPAKPKNTEDDADEFDLGDALDGEDKYTPTKAPAKPGKGGNSGGDFGDDDLKDIAGGDYKPDNTNSKGRSAGGPSGDSTQEGATKEGGNGTLAGIISGVLLSLAGGVTSYVLYQKKKLCFKVTGNSGEQNVKQDNAQGQREDPQSYSTLLQSQPVASN